MSPYSNLLTSRPFDFLSIPSPVSLHRIRPLSAYIVPAPVSGHHLRTSCFEHCLYISSSYTVSVHNTICAHSIRARILIIIPAHCIRTPLSHIFSAPNLRPYPYMISAHHIRTRIRISSVRMTFVIVHYGRTPFP